MKFLVTQSPERHATGYYLTRALESLGHEILPLLPPDRTGVRPGYAAHLDWTDLSARFPQADAFLYIDPDGLLPRGLENAPLPLACYVIDVHMNPYLRRELAKFFDLVFITHKDYVEAFPVQPWQTKHWLPVACDPDIHRDLQGARDLDVGFVGSLFDREHPRTRLWEALRAKSYAMNEVRYYPPEDICRVYSRSKIVVNYPVSEDLNMRVFEALSCGALLVTKAVKNGQPELFQPGVHFVTYNTPGEALDLVDYYLRHDKERETIARAGQRHVKEHHTYLHRAREIVRAVEGLKLPSLPRALPEDPAYVRAMVHGFSGSTDGVLFELLDRKRKGLSFRKFFYPALIALAIQLRRLTLRPGGR